MAFLIDMYSAKLLQLANRKIHKSVHMIAKNYATLYNTVT